MVNMHSHRYELDMHITRHARERMASRDISESELMQLIELGTAKYKDATHLWLAKHFENRTDNLLSVAAVLETKLVIKTVMHHFAWEEK